MAFRSGLPRNGVSLLACLLLCLLILYAGWSRNHQSAVGPTGKQIVVDTRKLGTAGADEGSRAGKPQFQFINRVVTAFDTEAATAIQQLLARKAQQRDPQLLSVVRHLIDPPPTERSMALSKAIRDTPQFMEVDALLNKTTNGFFVECGAYDGETASNSLPLESKRNWTGVLIEPSPYYYTQVLGKNRNVWSLNACLSPYEYATQVELESGKGQAARVEELKDADKNKTTEGQKGRLMLNDAKENNKKKVVPCFPLETILLALNRTHIDYFSLDVEGLELEVLKTIPFDRIDIKVLTVEYRHGKSGKEAYKRFMESKGFKTHKDLRSADNNAAIYVDDYVFVKL